MKQLHRASTIVLCVLSLLLTAAAGRIEGTDGADMLAGTEGPDVLDGGAGKDAIVAAGGDDVLIGGTGADLLDGGMGNDTYFFRLGDGQDKLLSQDGAKARRDVLRFDKGITPDMVTLSRGIGDNLIVQYGRGNKITVVKHFESDGASMFRIDGIVFYGGKAWGADYIRKAVVQPTPAGQYLVGYVSNDTLYGEGGADMMYGRFGNDTLYGGQGNDRLYGDEGNDTLIGGEGNDLLRGELGSDTYLYRTGDGMDTVQNFSRAGDVDVIRFVNHQKGAVKISTKGNDLMLLVDQGGKQAGLRVAGFNASNSFPIARIEYREGKPTTAQELLALFPRTSTAARRSATAQHRSSGPVRMERPKAPPKPKAKPTRRVETPLDRFIKQAKEEQQPAPTTPPAGG